MLTTEFVLCSKLDIITCTLMIRGKDVGSSPFLQWLKAQFCVHESQEGFINPIYVTRPHEKYKWKDTQDRHSFGEAAERQIWKERVNTFWPINHQIISNYIRLWGIITLGLQFWFSYENHLTSVWLNMTFV